MNGGLWNCAGLCCGYCGAVLNWPYALGGGCAPKGISTPVGVAMLAGCALFLFLPRNIGKKNARAATIRPSTITPAPIGQLFWLKPLGFWLYSEEVYTLET